MPADLGSRCPGRDGDPAPDRAPRPPEGPTETPPQPPTPTGIDYARLVGEAHHTELAKGVNDAALTGATLTVPAGELPGQLDLLTDLDVPDLDVAPGEGAS